MKELSDNTACVIVIFSVVVMVGVNIALHSPVAISLAGCVS